MGKMTEKFRASVKHASDGITYAMVHERNMHIHFWTSNVLFAFEFAVQPQNIWVALSIVMVFLVMAAESMNTAMERTIDLVCQGKPQYLAKIAKDASAGSVLLLSLASIVIGVELLVHTYPWVIRFPLNIRPLSSAMDGGAWIVIWILRLRRMSSGQNAGKT